MENATIELARVILLAIGLLTGMTFVIGCDLRTDGARRRENTNGGRDAVP